MQLLEIPEVELAGGGVMFQYLILELTNGEQTKTLLRGMNFQTYVDRIPERILESTREEIKGAGFEGSAENLTVDGGGTITLNPYTQEIVLFGASPEHGPEKNRSAAAAMLERAYPDHKINFFGEDGTAGEATESN